MVLLLDLDEEVSDPHADPDTPAGFTSPRRRQPDPENSVTAKATTGEADNERPNPNFDGLAAAVACYPLNSIVIQITQSIDLNTLHALARTCRQIRANLLQYRNRLVQQTLRCEHEAISQHLESMKPAGQKWHILGEAGHLVSGKVGKCARDLVEECRRCGRVVCRNCTLKPPSPARLPSRHRRLCPTCLSAPLALLTRANNPAHTPCTCATHVHLCAPCGASLATADTTYKRVWTWRTRYSTYLGGLGTGIGEGNEGVKCARGKECLGAKDVEVEFDCTSTPPASSSSSGSSGSESDQGDGGGTPLAEKEEAGYWRQEVEGLGGIVRKKYRKRERVGGTVREWEDEREGAEVLGREKRGEERSWCGWCGRVVLGGRDLDEREAEG